MKRRTYRLLIIPVLFLALVVGNWPGLILAIFGLLIVRSEFVTR